MKTIVMEAVDSNNNTEDVKYSLRPRRTQRSPKSLKKTERLPLSRHRRRSANARERSRMKEINDAFEALRKVVGGCEGTEKTTKISTLRLAINYISSLNEILHGKPKNITHLQDSSSQCSRNLEDTLMDDANYHTLDYFSFDKANNLTPQNNSQMSLPTQIEGATNISSTYVSPCENNPSRSFRGSFSNFKKCSVTLLDYQQQMLSQNKTNIYFSQPSNYLPSSASNFNCLREESDVRKFPSASQVKPESKTENIITFIGENTVRNPASKTSTDDTDCYKITNLNVSGLEWSYD